MVSRRTPARHVFPDQTASETPRVASAPSIESAIPGQGPVIVMTAALAEASAVARAFRLSAPESEWKQATLEGRWSLVRCGVGKSNAAMCVARGLRGMDEPGAVVLNLGICGVLPAESNSHHPMPAPQVGSVVVAEASVYADEGVQTPDGFQDMAGLGFPYWAGAKGGASCMSVVAEGGLVERVASKLAERVGASVHVGRIATVSTCSGTNALAREIAARTGAIAEGMEGAAVGHAVARCAEGGRQIDFLEVRVVSNTTGDRGKQVWDIKGALTTLTRVAEALRGAPA